MSNRSNANIRTGGGPERARGPWCGVRPDSGAVLVISQAAPGVRYVGRMVGDDFHVVLDHVAAQAGALDTQLYRNLRRRLLSGWQVWKEPFYDNGARVCLDCLTFSGVKAFLGCLGSPSLPACDPRRLEQTWPAFAGSVPEGIICPIPAYQAYSLKDLGLPATPLRAVFADRYLMPVLEHGGKVWIPLRVFCRWFCLDAASCLRFLNGHRGEFGEQALNVPGLPRSNDLYMPLESMPDCLLALASHWRGQGQGPWERAVFMGHLLEGYARCGLPGLNRAETAETKPVQPSCPAPDRGAPGDSVDVLDRGESLRRAIDELEKRVSALERRSQRAFPAEVMAPRGGQNGTPAAAGI